MNKRYGFTLIELLVVIAIIALLLGITVPVLHKVRAHAKAVQCSANIRELTLALTLYERTNGRFPPAFVHLFQLPFGSFSDFPGNAMHDRMGRWWFQYATEYYDGSSDLSTTPLWCPSRRVQGNLSLRNNVLCGNYGVNKSILRESQASQPQKEFAGKSLSLDELPHPARTLLTADSGYATISWWNATSAPPKTLRRDLENSTYVPGLSINTEKEIWPCQQHDAFEGRHPGRKVNVGYADGHVARTKAESLGVFKTDTGYRNRVPTWTPMPRAD